DNRGKPSTCDNCQGTGFFERTGVFELVIMNDGLRKVVKQSKSLPEISAQFRRAKMLYLQEQVLRKVIEGTVSINEMIRVLSSSKTKKAKPT
ncbi:MAG: ATPase, T2SS/T4P/T4SS family, partial [Planctomycetota bacterium]